jgi:hypothetical protein
MIARAALRTQAVENQGMQTRRSRLRRPGGKSNLLVAAACGLVVVACWGFAGAADAPPHPLRALAESDGVRVVVTAVGSGASATLHFTVSATVAHARGALGYDVAFGDGTTTSNPVPQFCVAGNGIRQHAVWHLAHHYAAGSYRVSITVRVNCTRAAATARLTVRAE